MSFFLHLCPLAGTSFLPIANGSAKDSISYFHRSLNIQKLIDVKFTYVPRSMTLARMLRLYKTAAQPQLSGLREMEDRDVSGVADLFTRYMQRFTMGPVMTLDEIRHQFLSGRGRIDEPSEHYRRPDQVVWTYVVEVIFFWLTWLLSFSNVCYRTQRHTRSPTSFPFTHSPRRL